MGPFSAPARVLAAIALFAIITAGGVMGVATPSVATGQVSPSAGCSAVNGGAFDWTVSGVGGADNGDVGPQTFVAGEVLNVSFTVSADDPSSGDGVFILGVGPIVIIANRVYELPGVGGIGIKDNVVTTGSYTVNTTDGLTLFSRSAVGNGFGSHSMQTTVTCTPIPGSLSGRYFQDLNNDDIDNSEPGIEGILVTLLDAGGNPTGPTTTTAADGSYSFTDLAPGTYGVRFTDPSNVLTGMELVAANVGDDTTDSDAIGDTTTSTITGIGVVGGNDTPDNDAGARLISAATGTIVIAKDTIGGDGTFSFTGELGDFDLTTVNGTVSQSFSSLAPGTYAVTELASATHDFSGLVCADPTSNSSTNVATATIDLAADETVTCTYANTITSGGITITKDAVGGDGTFGFSGDLGDFDLTTVNGTVSQTFSSLAPGTYAVTEFASATHVLSGLVCVDPTSNSSTNGATATIDLAAGETVTCTYTNTEVSARTSDIIVGFMERRGDVLSDAGPRFQHFLDRFAGNGQNGFSATPFAYQAIVSGNGSTAFDAVIMDEEARKAFWVEGAYERYRLGAPGTIVDGSVVMLQGGFDVRFGEHIILGVTAVGDGARELSNDLGYQVEGLGWMAGPYGAVRLGDNMVFDAKFLWGQSWNNISPFLTYTDQFTTTRWLATARLAGEAELGPMLFRPEAYVAYFSETQAEYVDTNGITIPEQRVAVGRVTFGPEIAIPIATTADGLVEPRIAMEGVWDFTSGQLSAQVNGGLQFSSTGGASLLIHGGYGGLFVPGLRSWNVGANITLPLQ